MMRNFYDKTISVYRLTAIAGTQKESYGTIAVGIKCHIQQAEDSKVEYDFGKMYQVFRLFCPLNTNIKENDKLNDGVNDYIVKAVSTYEVGSIKHLEAIILIPE